MNVNAIKANFNKLGIEMKIFFTLILCADAKNGAGEVNKVRIAKYLKTSPQTVGKYLKNFVECNMIKYKYSGRFAINPDFYYVGPTETKERAKYGYAQFKSDM